MHDGDAASRFGRPRRLRQQPEDRPRRGPGRGDFFGQRQGGVGTRRDARIDNRDQNIRRVAQLVALADDPRQSNDGELEPVR